jgi:acetate kinase
MKILVINVGSTSLKYKLYRFFSSLPQSPNVLAEGRIERIGDVQSPAEHSFAGQTSQTSDGVSDLHEAVAQTVHRLTGTNTPLATLNELDAVGFKTVHLRRPPGTYALDDETLARMADFQDVAPGHNPAYLEVIRSFRSTLPNTPLVGVFETAFHRTIPPHAAIYGVPYAWYQDHGIRRYGFHGASHSYIALRTAELLHRSPIDPSLRIVSCHLGGSSSVCAIRGGNSVDTSMGFSPQEGLLNATRTGSLDAFAVLYMQERLGLSPGRIGQILTHEGGLLGISGISGDMRDLQEAAEGGHDRAALAIDAFCYGVRKGIAEMAAAMGGLDAVSFTGGIGERSHSIRKRICSDLAFLGLTLHDQRNRTAVPDARLSSDEGRVPVWVIQAEEEVMVAREVVRFLSNPLPQAGP